MRTFVLLIAAFAFAACADSTPMDQTSAPNQAPDVRASEFNSLGDILASQPDEVKARYAHRHPAETLAFFWHRTRHDRGRGATGWRLVQ